MLPSIAFDTWEDEGSDEALKSLRTPAENEAVETHMHLSPSPDSLRASWTPSTPAGKPGPRKHSFFVSLTLTIPLLAVALIWYICSASHRRGQAAGGISRRLSDRDEAAEALEDSIVEGCLSLEADLGISQTQGHHHMQDDPSQRIAALVSLFSNAAAEFEWSRRAQPMVHGGPPFRGVPEGRQSNAGDHPERSQRARSCGGSREVLEPAAKRVKFTVSAPESNPELNPDVWIEDSGSTYEQMQGPAYEQQGLEGHQWPSGEATGVSESVGRPPGLSPPLALQPPHGKGTIRYGSTDPRYHPFVRLPLLEPGVVPQPFNPAEVFVVPPMVAMYRGHLLEMRRLLVQQTLNQKDANLLLRLATELANSAWFKASASVRQVRPIFATVSLGTTFLALDALMAVVELFGSHMKIHLWWDRFAAAFDTNYSVVPPSLVPRKSTKFHVDLANDLLNAMRIYKTGKRPPSDIVVELKMRLFFSPLSPPLFHDSQWDPWRRDHNLFKLFGYMPE